jgi:rhodanese-related sulfurtransferase
MIRVVVLLLISTALYAQDDAHCIDRDFQRKVEDYIRGTVPVMDVEKLHQAQKEVVILDARETAEFEVSHIEGALRIGYDKPDFNILKDIPLDTDIVVYCSIGYRSEKIGEKLQERGYTNVSNLYGGIFEWSNRQYELVDTKGQKTNTLHTYSRRWSKWVDPEKTATTW